MQLLLPLPLKLLAQLLIVPLRLPLQHKAPLTRPSLPLRKLRLAAKLIKKAWNVCSRSLCPSKSGQKSALFERRACRGVFYARANGLGNAVGTLHECFHAVPVKLPDALSRCDNELFGHIGQRVLAVWIRLRHLDIRIELLKLFS